MVIKSRQTKLALGWDRVLFREVLSPRLKFVHSLALAAGGVMLCVGCTSSAVSRPAYPNGSWTEKVTSAVKSGTGKMTAALTPKKKEVESTVSTEAPNGKPGPASYVAVAQMAEKKGNFEQAETAYQKALKLDPDHMDALLGYAHMQESRNDFDGAMKHYSRALKKHPKEAAVHNDVGLCYHRCGKLPEAAKELELAIELRPQRKLYRDNLAEVLVDQGRNDEALKHLVYAHDVAVGNYNLGYLLVQKHKNAEALVCFHKALEKDPALAEARQWVVQLTGPQPGIQFAQAQVGATTNATYTAPMISAPYAPPAAAPQVAQRPMRVPQVNQTR